MVRRTIVFGMIAALASSVIASDLWRPDSSPAVVNPCTVSKPGEYTINVGDAFEIAYSFPVSPNIAPKKIELEIGSNEEDRSRFTVLGPFKVVRPRNVGGGETILLAVAKKASPVTAIRLVVDGKQYEYRLTILDYPRVE